MLSALCLVLWQALLYDNLVLDRRNRVDATEAAVYHARDTLSRILRAYSSDLYIVARNPELRQLAFGDSAAIKDVVADFKVVVSEKPMVAQLRYIDRGGREVVRVDRRGNAAVAIARADLQDKRNRYYFRDSIGLPPGALYVSPIDLNVEHGKIQTPWSPMLRLATPLAGADGKAAGIVIVNIFATDFITSIERGQPVRKVSIQLLNHDGYWLAGVPGNRRWGFMFGHETTMAKTAPSVWRRVSREQDGAFDGPGGKYIFQTLDPATQINVARSGTGHSPIRWTVLAIVPAITPGDLWRRENIPAVLIGLLAIAAISWGWSGAVTARRESDERREEAETELVRVERLAGLGSLVAGIAHELNTPIGNGLTVASALSDRVTGLEGALASGKLRRSVLESFAADMREGTGIMLRGLERAATLIGHFKQVAVDQTSEQRRTFHLDALLHDVVATLGPQLRKEAVTLVETIKTQAEMDSYPGPLSQVLINLITNSTVHGFKDTADGQGRITISARDLPSGQIELAVRDNGCGIADELQPRIFEPFVTTRMGQGGSGLGLSIVFNIVVNVLGGAIHVESRQGEGTAMIIRMPRSAPLAAGDQLERSYGNGQRAA